MVGSPVFLRALSAGIGALPLLGAVLVGAPLAQAQPVAATTSARNQAAPAATAQPLEVTLSTISPSVVPERGPVRITGTLTNVDDETWSTINLYPFISAEPLTTEAELAAAVDVPADQDVGGRIIEDGPLVTVDELAPGEVFAFTMEVPRSSYSVQRGGAYWFGVHALGEGPVPRDLVADGRARTFLPYLPSRRVGAVETALVVPLRRYLEYEDDGSLARSEAWSRSLAEGGRLRGLVDFGVASDGDPVTWLVDPALLDALGRLAVGNPPRSLAPTQPTEPEDPESPASPSGSGTVVPAPADPEADTSDDLEPEDAELATAATQLLTDLQGAVGDDQVLTLPYGDLDVPAAAEHDPDLYEVAVRQPSAVLDSWATTTSPALGSPSGYLDLAGLDLAAPGDTVLATDQMFAGQSPAVAAVGDHRLVVTSSGAAAGGPGPGPALTSIGLRQRLLSEAAVRMLSPSPEPLVMTLPVQWNPDDVNVFFDGLRQAPFVDLSTVSEVSARTATIVAPEDLVYPKDQVERQLDEDAFEAVQGLIASGRRLESLLTRNDQVAAVVTEQGLSSASYSSRQASRLARASVDRSREWIDERLASVRVDAPPGVTLSGGTGSFGATLTNELDEPVTVVVAARSDTGIVVGDSDEIQLAPDSETTVLMNARTRRLGVHSVTLYVTDAEGRRLGSSDELPIRSTQVSTVIWVIMASGAAILFLAIGVRLSRRIRHRHDPPAAEVAAPLEPVPAPAGPADPGSGPSPDAGPVEPEPEPAS